MDIINNPVLSINEEDRNAVVDFLELIITQCQNHNSCANCIFDNYCDCDEHFSNVAKRLVDFFIDGEHVKIEREY